MLCTKIPTITRYCMLWSLLRSTLWLQLSYGFHSSSAAVGGHIHAHPRMVTKSQSNRTIAHIHHSRIMSKSAKLVWEGAPSERLYGYEGKGQWPAGWITRIYVRCKGKSKGKCGANPHSLLCCCCFDCCCNLEGAVTDCCCNLC